MKYIALIKPDGLIDSIRVPVNSQEYILDSYINNLLIKEIDTEEPISTLIKTLHWTGTAFAMHEEKADHFHEWCSTSKSYIEPPDYLDRLKAIEIERINQETFLKINAVYPVWKQCNILRKGKQQELADMSLFIDNLVAESNIQTESFSKCSTIVEVETVK